MKISELAAQARPLWLDYTAYATALLAGGHAPWLDTAACASWIGKAQSLLHSHVMALPLADVAGALLDNRPELLQVMVDKRRRVIAPLRLLLADEGLRIRVVDLMLAWRSKFAQAPLVLLCPSPRHLLLWAHARCAPGETLVVDDDAVDSAAAYMADFLRVFSQCGLDAVLLQEREDTEPESAEALALYRPLFNLAAHYRWELGLQLPAAAAALPLAAEFAFVIAPRALTDKVNGILTGPDVWSGDELPQAPAGGFVHATVPATAGPEEVLARLTAWRRV